MGWREVMSAGKVRGMGTRTLSCQGLGAIGSDACQMGTLSSMAGLWGTGCGQRARGGTNTMVGKESQSHDLKTKRKMKMFLMNMTLRRKGL